MDSLACLDILAVALHSQVDTHTLAVVDHTLVGAGHQDNLEVVAPFLAVVPCQEAAEAVPRQVGRLVGRILVAVHIQVEAHIQVVDHHIQAAEVHIQVEERLLAVARTPVAVHSLVAARSLAVVHILAALKVAARRTLEAVRTLEVRHLAVRRTLEAARTLEVRRLAGRRTLEEVRRLAVAFLVEVHILEVRQDLAEAAHVAAARLGREAVLEAVVLHNLEAGRRALVAAGHTRAAALRALAVAGRTQEAEEAHGLGQEVAPVQMDSAGLVAARGQAVVVHDRSVKTAHTEVAARVLAAAAHALLEVARTYALTL